MIKFNSDNIFVGYLKQLLKQYNLPQCEVFKNESEVGTYLDGKVLKAPMLAIIRNYKYDEINERDSVVLITKAEDTKLITKQFIAFYDEGMRYTNFTTNLVINNNILDTHTHEYLGNYLRFLRDYKDLDLMPLYNCYSNHSYTEDGYTYYVIPVKYNRDYILKYRANSGIDYLFTTDTTNSELLDILIPDLFSDGAYKRINSINNRQNVIISTKGITDIYPSYLNNLFLVIRVSKINTSNIVLLECDAKKIKESLPKVVVNVEEYQKYNEENCSVNDYIYNISLATSKITDYTHSITFSDRLIEYLCNNVINNNDEISQNVSRVIESLYGRYYDGDILETYIKKHRANIKPFDRLNIIKALTDNNNIKINRDDILGDVNKDVESVLNDSSFQIDNGGN